MNSSPSLFLKSANCSDSEVFPLSGFDAWFEGRMAAHRFKVEQIPFSGLDKWGFLPDTGNLGHATGRFFTIEGISVETNYGEIPKWNQPIINQPEIGLLGFATKRINGVLHFLMQAKMEPGNLHYIQLAPTLQATKSNYTRVHEGKSPPFLEYFHDNPHRHVLVDVLQSEQGGRFLRKRNRNIIVEVPADENLGENPDYIWLTLGQVGQLLQRDNVINMDARTVLSCIAFAPIDGRATPTPHALNSMDQILSWFTEMKCTYELNVQAVALNEAIPWQKDDYRIAHPSGNFFEVIAMRIEADNREVASWTQPLIKPCREGLIAFITKEIQGEPHFLIQAKVEAGNFDIVEMAPTVQCLTGDYRKAPESDRPPFVEYALNARKSQILVDSMQSEDGGRFFREENRNLILKAGTDFPDQVPKNYLWISYSQLKKLIRYNNIVNIQARGLLSSIPPPQAL
jgi:dTDP-4-dehydro-6-deoxy-alpha-D-glucopyranose 2,3-dehydratase